MKITVQGLDGRSHSWNLAAYANKPRAGSKLHEEARVILSELFPFDSILEEVQLPGTSLFADFYIHRPRLLVEVQGEQHYKFNSHFFKTQSAFREAQMRDRNKKEWCELNSIQLVELPFNKRDEWRKIIHERH